MSIISWLKLWKRVKTLKPSAWEQYGKQMAEMRRDGNSLRAIGRACGGISGERVRQILNRRCGGVKTELLPRYKVAKVIGCSDKYLRNLGIKGVVKPRP